MPTRTHNLAILFADITGSTRLFATHGDIRARSMTADCIEALKFVVSSEGGQVVKTIGDGIMCTFSTADAAYLAATKIRETQRQQELSVHSGFHWGSVVDEGDDVFGDAVNVASRVADLAKADEIITTEDTVDQLSPVHRSSVRLLDGVAVKGKNVPINVYLVAAKEEDATAYRNRLDQSMVIQRASMELIYQAQRSVITEDVREYVIGRTPDCDLLVDHEHVSRRHATIECKRGKFFLLDHSTNGTYIQNDREQPASLRREMVQLVGGGLISLGGQLDWDPEHLIRFRDTRWD